MYGTVARMLVKPGMREQFLTLWREINEREPPGWVAEYVYQSDSNADELFMTVAFESDEAYRKNAESPEMDASYRRIRALLAADPEWHDGVVIYTYP